MKPRVFVGSSSEGLDTAYALQASLEDSAEVTVWTQDVFRPSEFVLEALLRQLSETDVGLFVFTPDDTLVIRGIEQSAVRDNVVFELGMYVGRLGRDRSFIVAPRGGNPRLPSDLLGITVVTYEGDRADGRLEAAIGPASAKIRSALKQLSPRLTRVPYELEMPLLQRRGVLSGQQLKLLEEVERGEPISRQALASRFSGMTESELHYRLEQLRLLQFVTWSSSATQQPSDITLHPLYEHARIRSPRLRTSE